MVIGNGLVATAFEQYKNENEFLIFASGVSNSKSCTNNDFLKEKTLLIESIDKNISKKIVYFSTTSIEDPDLRTTPYILHKFSMEQLIKEKAKNYSVFRLPNLAGKTNNPNTILNFLFFHIKSDQLFQVWESSERNIIDVEDVYIVVNYILKQKLFTNQVINIANPRNYSVPDIVKEIENFCGKKANFNRVKKGATFSIDVSVVKPLYDILQIHFADDYLSQILKKYYS